MIDTAVLEKFRNALGPKGIMTDPADIEPWVHDWRGRYHGAAALIV